MKKIQCIAILFFSLFAINNAYANDKNIYLGLEASINVHSLEGLNFYRTSSAIKAGYDFNPIRLEVNLNSLLTSLNTYYDVKTFSLLDNKIVPYFNAGLGFYGFNFGGGANYNFDENWQANIGLKYSVQTFFRNLSYNVTTGVVGVSYFF